jgi:hypothetical protein
MDGAWYHPPFINVQCWHDLWYTGSMRTPLVRLMEKLSIDAASGCWTYTGSERSQGYGLFLYEGNRVSAHRAAYMILVGAIPDSGVVHHLCRNRRCCNPAHLQLTTPSEHPLLDPTIVQKNKEKTHCIRGHEFTPENTYVFSEGRACRECRRLEKAARWDREHPGSGPHNRSKTHCVNGHEFTPENTKYSPLPNGGQRRSCRECSRQATARYHDRHPSPRKGILGRPRKQ